MAAAHMAIAYQCDERLGPCFIMIGRTTGKLAIGIEGVGFIRKQAVNISEQFRIIE